MYLYGAREYACMQKLVPVSLTSCIGLANMHVVLLSLVALIAFLMSFLRLVILWMVSNLFLVRFSLFVAMCGGPLWGVRLGKGDVR